VAQSAGVPVVPGGTPADQTTEAIAATVREVGFPVLLKPSAGGGGIGMKTVRDDGTVRTAIEQARREATAAFGDGTLYVERLIERPRHIEIQVLADSHGHVVHLFERECSIQRRNQKVIEEAPSPLLDPQTRAAMGAQAVALAKAVNYDSAGTVEFVAGQDKSFYFLEMNTRLQVEHPVTELVTGIDLVEQQLLVAAGRAVTFDPDAVPATGHALELRVNAEDPVRFLPGPGLITAWEEPHGPGIRVDSGYTVGNTVTPHYDSLMAKLVVHGADRAEALERARAAVAAFRVEGPKCNLLFFAELLVNPEFVSGDYDTGIVARMRA
jgi:acetyl-CoA carboxylase biotin carboxylase subunit